MPETTPMNEPVLRGRDNRMEDLRNQARTVGRDVRDLAATAGDVARHQLDPVEHYIQAHPVKSLLIAAGVGAVLTLLLGRR